MDSWSTVQQLHGSGFTVKQAEVITDLLAWILRVRLNEFKRSLVTQPQAEYVKRRVVLSFRLTFIGYFDDV